VGSRLKERSHGLRERGGGDCRIWGSFRSKKLIFFSLQAGVTASSGVEISVRDTWNKRRGTSDTLGHPWMTVHPGLGWLVDSGSLFSSDEHSEG